MPKKCARFCHRTRHWSTELQVRFVDERRWCQGVVVALVAEIPPGNAPQLVVHHVDQAVARGIVPLTPREQERRHVVIVGHVPPSFSQSVEASSPEQGRL